MFQLGKNPIYVCDEVTFIGDVHSEGNKLESLLGKLLPLKPNSHLVFLGDLLDTGKQSVKTLSLIKSLRDQYPGQVFVIMGNHEEMFIKYFNKQENNWLQHGGQVVLTEFKNTFQLESNDDILNKLKELGLWDVYESLIPYYEHKDIFASHAPLDDVLISMYSKIDELDEEPVEKQEEAVFGLAERLGSHLRWKFTEEVPLQFDFGKTLISGHQHSHKRPKLFEKRVFLDCGAGYKDVPIFAVKMPGKVITSS